MLGSNRWAPSVMAGLVGVVEDLVDLVVVRLAARAVRLDQADRLEHEGQVALHVGVDAQEEVALAA